MPASETGALRRVDTETESGGLPASLIAAIEQDGGLWFASDSETNAAQVVVAVHHARAAALRLDVRDLSLLRDLPEIRYLHLRTDGRPSLEPVGALGGLRALIIESGALRGEFDPFASGDLRWLRLSLGGKGGAAVLTSLLAGHPGLEYLAIRETQARAVAELASGFPALRHLRIGFADRLRGLGELGHLASSLRGLELWFTDLRSLEGLEALSRLEVLALTGGRVRDIGPLADMRGLRYARLESAAGVESLEPLRGHPTLRMLELSKLGQVDLTVLESIPGLVAVGRGPRFAGETPYPDLRVLPRSHPLRVEWERAVSG